MKEKLNLNLCQIKKTRTMTSNFKFNNQLTPQNTIDIENVGNCCIQGIDEDSMFYYYLKIVTQMGNTEIFSYGPIIPDIDELPDIYSFTYQKMKYNDKRMIVFINKWLNDKFKHITTAEEIGESLFEKDIVDFRKYLGKYSQ